MGILKKLSNVIEGKANKFVDELSNPIEELDLAITKRNEAISESKKAASKVIGSVQAKRVERDKLQNKVKEYEIAIREALKQGNESDAAELVAEMKEVEVKVEGLNNTINSLQADVNTIMSSISDLEKEVGALEVNRDSFEAREKTADAKAMVGEILAGVNKNEHMSLSDIEKKIIDKENYANGLDAFKKKDPEEKLKKYTSGAKSYDLQKELDKYR